MRRAAPLTAALALFTAAGPGGMLLGRDDGQSDRRVVPTRSTPPIALYLCGEALHPRAAEGWRLGEPSETTVGELVEAFGGRVTDDRLDLPDGRTFSEDEGCDGVPATVRVIRWDTPTDRDPETFSDDLSNVGVAIPLQLVTVGLAGRKERMPPPPSPRMQSSCDRDVLTSNPPPPPGTLRPRPSREDLTWHTRSPGPTSPQAMTWNHGINWSRQPSWPTGWPKS
jgi:hypothetical protein